MVDETVEHFWDALEAAEVTASRDAELVLGDFRAPIRSLYGCAVEMPSFAPAELKATEHFRLAGMFLKRSLNDLRAMWLLIARGYTSQAASVVAALYENAMAAAVMVLDPAFAKRLLRDPHAKPDWGARTLTEMYAKRENARTGRVDNPNEKFVDAIYRSYQWLCKIKHATVLSVHHDAYSTASAHSPRSWSIRAQPDIRSEDQPMKAAIIWGACMCIFAAVEQFVVAAPVGSIPTQFMDRLNSLPPVLAIAMQTHCSGGLPFGVCK